MVLTAPIRADHIKDFLLWVLKDLKNCNDMNKYLLTLVICVLNKYEAGATEHGQEQQC